MTGNVGDKCILLQINIFLLIIFSTLHNCQSIKAQINYEVEGEGFHRNLKYYVDTGTFKNKSCHVALYLELPSALYVNVDELADLRRLKKSQSCAVGEIDVERFAEKAQRQNVTICSRLSDTKTTLRLPVHQRYQFAVYNGDFVDVTLPVPKLLLGCRERLNEHRVSKIDLCAPCVDYARKWRNVPYTMENNYTYIWQIPIGDSSRLWEVVCITLGITTIGAIFVLWTIWGN